MKSPTYCSPPNTEAWKPWSPQQLADKLSDVSAPWYIAGGWALDLWHGEQTREHADLEFVVLADGKDQFRDELSELEFFSANNGKLTHCAKTKPLPNDIWQFWGADINSNCWRVDMMIEKGSSSVWTYKRAPSIILPRSEAILETSNGITYLAPQLVLLFKAKYLREKDQQDFVTVIPKLEKVEREGLCDLLQRLHPAHPWLPLLS